MVHPLVASDIPTNISIINHSILAIGKHDAIGFVNFEDGKVTFNHVIDEKIMNHGIDGISCISGHKTEPIYAIGDISTPPRIVLFSYPNQTLGQLKSMTYIF